MARMGIRDVLLVEAGNYEQFCIGESIPPETKPLFIRLGIFEKFLAEGHEPCYGSRSYWGDDRRGHNDSLFSVFGHGWHLDRARFNRFIAKEAQAAGVTLITRSTFQQCQELADGRFQLSIDTDQASLRNIKADFVVDATGALGVFARQQGCKKRMDRPLIAMGMRFSLKNVSRPISQVTHLEAVEYGWWYAAPLPDDTLMAMLTTDAKTAKALSLSQSAAWLSHLQDTANTAQWIADATPVDEAPMNFSVPSFMLDKVVGRRWMAIGDTASAYDPITSQGIIKALSDAVFAAETIAPYLHRQEDKLENYQRTIAARYQQYLAMRNDFYRIEKRWLQSAFWQRQQAGYGED
ncbi:MAG TPA: FAD-dependent oxidoreductase [Gallionella sp.]|nr:FAD-dependent oxidoreductase [Gallionella sp.]